MLCVITSDDSFVAYTRKTVQEILEKTPYDIRLVTNQVELFKDLDSPRVILISDIPPDLLLETDVPHIPSRLRKRFGAKKFNCNVKHLCFKNIPKKYEYIICVDADIKLSEWDTSIEEKIDLLLERNDAAASRINFLLGDDIDVYRKTPNKSLYRHKIEAYKLLEWEEKYENARLPSEHFLILKNISEKVNMFYEKWKLLTHTLQNTNCVTWGDSFEIGIALYHAGFRDIGYIEDSDIGLVFNGNNLIWQDRMKKRVINTPTTNCRTHMENTIFVQIASYRDPELIPTLKDITTNSANPENLKITVNWQHGEDETIDDLLDAGFDLIGSSLCYSVDTDGTPSEFTILETEFNKALVDFIDVDYTETRGTCWARNLVQQQYNSEKYTLQLDSHHRFIPNWDTELINMMEDLRKQSKKPVLTGYIPSYDPENDPAGRVTAPWQTNFDRFIPEGAVFFIPSTMKDWENKTQPIRARFYSGHFAFADGSFAEEVQHDPEYFFHGEEISIAARAFTHGYDLYTPHKTVAWHEYTRKGRTKIWDDHTTPERKKKRIKKDWVERNNICHARNRILFGMDGEDPNQIDFGRYGFGTERTLQEYEEYAGINFKLRGVQQHTLDDKEPVYPVVNEMTQEEWEDSFRTSVDVRICVHKGDLGDIPDDIEFCFVGVHDKDNNELHRKDLSREEFYKYYSSGDWIDYRYICIIGEVPKYYVLWPYSKSQGWLKKVIKETEYTNKK